MTREERDFSARSEQDQQDFLTQTWCNHCMKADLGMKNPVEYEIDGVIYIEGECKVCGQPVVTEIADDSTDGDWDDD